jgi:hypothetical protein
MHLGETFSPLVPAKAGTQCFGQDKKKELDARLRGHERI